jgi:signal peptidase II
MCVVPFVLTDHHSTSWVDRMTLARKARVFWPLLFVVLLSDCTTKYAAEAALGVEGASQELVGETLRLTLVYNQGAAMGLLGPWSKELLGVFSVCLAIVFFVWYRRAPQGAGVLAAAIALVIAGALGNGWQRLFSESGVVDFIDVAVGATRFWVFNLADVAVHAGVIILLFTLGSDPPRGTRAQPHG